MEPTVEHATRPDVELSTRPFRILALDGGGIMGAFTASVLATVEAATGQRAWDHFDLITGTSTGGLIALALGMGNDAARICRMYHEHGHLIFPRDRFWWDGMLRQLRRPKFSTDPLRRAIGELLQDATLTLPRSAWRSPSTMPIRVKSSYSRPPTTAVTTGTRTSRPSSWRSRRLRPRPTSRPIQSSATLGPSPTSTAGSGRTVR